MPADKIQHSQHYRERTEEIRYIILHCSAGTPEEQIRILDALGLSVHYIIGQDGTVTENLPPEKIAFHAGLSKWQNSESTSLNGCSIGIELESPMLGQCPSDYTGKQINALIVLLKELVCRYKIRKENILGHSDISPTRKPDPGAGFPWKKLYQHNLSVWYKLYKLDKETDETKLLAKIGYDTTEPAAARYAFCRHFMPEEVMIEEDIQNLLETVYPKDFSPGNPDKYLRILRAVSYAAAEERTANYWFLKK